MSDLQPAYDELIEELMSFSADDLVAPPMGWDPAELDFTWDPAALNFTWDPAELTIDLDSVSLGSNCDLTNLQPDRRRAHRTWRGRR